MAHRTLRRDTLRKMIERGELVAVDSYRFDDMLGESRGDAKDLPVRFSTGYGDFKEGFCNIDSFDLTTKSGDASISEDGTMIHLRVHSNSSFDFRRLPATNAHP